MPFLHPRSPFQKFNARALTSARPSQRVIVIGAGMAGLSAAYQLLQAGHDVTVLEAKAAPGGRVHTLRAPFAGGQYAEAGAMFIHGHHELAIGYIEMLGLPLVPIKSGGVASMSLYLRGTRIDDTGDTNARWPVTLSDAERQLGYMGMFQTYILPVVKSEVGDPRAPGWPPASLLAYEDMSFTDFLRSRGASPGAIEVLRLGYFSLFGDSMECVCALDVLRDLAFTIDGIPRLLGQAFPVKSDLSEQAARLTYTIAGGNDRLPTELAAREPLAGKIVCGAPVVRIENGDGGVRVVTRAKTWQAARVICTLPFSVLREMELPIDMSAEKRRVIADLPYTSVLREYVQVRTRTWEKLGTSGTAATDLPVMYVNHQTVTQPGPRGILEAYSSGPRARAWSALEAGERHRRTVADIDRVFPGFSAEVESHATKDWGGDEWQRGGYCSFEPGQMARNLPIISRAEGRLHFAGDHTSAMPAWIEGALESGHRAAAEVHAAAE